MSRNRFHQKEIKDKQYLKVFNLSELKSVIAPGTTRIDTIRVRHLALQKQMVTFYAYVFQCSHRSGSIYFSGIFHVSIFIIITIFPLIFILKMNLFVY